MRSTVVQLLARIKPVPKAAAAAQGERPSVRVHYEGLRLASDLRAGGPVLLIDDVVAGGATLLGAVERLARLAGAPVRGFAATRTVPAPPHVQRMRDPVLGSIHAGVFGVRRQS